MNIFTASGADRIGDGNGDQYIPNPHRDVFHRRSSAVEILSLLAGHLVPDANEEI